MHRLIVTVLWCREMSLSPFPGRLWKDRNIYTLLEKLISRKPLESFGFILVWSSFRFRIQIRVGIRYQSNVSLSLCKAEVDLIFACSRSSGNLSRDVFLKNKKTASSLENVVGKMWVCALALFAVVWRRGWALRPRRERSAVGAVVFSARRAELAYRQSSWRGRSPRSEVT